MVQIQSKQQRGILANGLRNFIPDILLAWAGAYLFDIGFLGFIGILIAFQCIYFVIWLKKFVWGWFLFWFSGRKKMATLAGYRANVEELHQSLIRNLDAPKTRAAFHNLIERIVVHPTGYREPYEISVYGRLSAIVGVDLF